MKSTFRLFLALAVCGLFTPSTAGATSVEQILSLKTQTVDVRTLAPTGEEIYIQTPFAKPIIVDEEALKQIKASTVLSIELVYSAFKSSESFDQTGLNKQRLQSLKALIPELFTNNLIQWKIIEQNGCDSPESCNKLFHGFIVNIRPEPTAESMKAEVDFLDELFAPTGSLEFVEIKEDAMRIPSGPYGAHAAPDWSKVRLPTEEEYTPKPDENNHTPAFYKLGYPGVLMHLNSHINTGKRKVDETYNTRLTIDPKGYAQTAELTLEKGEGIYAKILQQALRNMVWIPARTAGKRVEDKVEFTITVNNKGVSVFVDGVPVEFPERTAFSLFGGVAHTGNIQTDSNIFKVIERHPEWNDMAVIGDLTGSMSPYTAQILLWHKLNIEKNTNRTKHFYFFNDGDSKPNMAKKTGKVGGIYDGIGDSFDDVKDLAKKCMMAGGGGDAPENNVETLIKATTECLECKEFVMIADNYATPRDMRLIDQVNKPVRVILCGVWGPINPAYLEMARKTGGSVHTMEEDLDGLMEYTEGSTFEFNGSEYQIKNGVIIRLSKM